MLIYRFDFVAFAYSVGVLLLPCLLIRVVVWRLSFIVGVVLLDSVRACIWVVFCLGCYV